MFCRKVIVISHIKTTETVSHFSHKVLHLHETVLQKCSLAGLA